MSGIQQEVFDVVKDLVEKVVVSEEIERVVADLVNNVVEKEQSIQVEEQEEEQEWPEQVGGANLRVGGKVVKVSGGRFKGSATSVTLQIEIPRNMIAHPNGPELFGQDVIRLILQNAPAAGSQNKIKVGVTFESDELHESVGLSLKDIQLINYMDVVGSMENMAQSNKSPLELDVPRLSMRITYITFPNGSGKRRYTHEKLLNEIAFEKKRRGMSNGEDEDFEALHNNEDVVQDDAARGFLDNEAREVHDNEEEEEEEEEDVDLGFDEGGNEIKSGNVMRNNVSKDCLPHALYQSMCYRTFKNNRTLINRKLYLDSLAKTDNQQRYRRIHEAVSEMKRRAGVEKSTNFDYEDIEKFQNTVFANFQIVVLMDRHYIPYFQGPFVGEGKELYVSLENQHYCGVRTLCALFKTKYYCSLCQTGYRDVKAHYKCKLLHQTCGKFKEDCPKTPFDIKTPCASCGITFRSVVCFKNHKLKGPRGGKSRCDLTHTCKKCNKPVYQNKHTRPHVCGNSFCHRCFEDREEGHHCTMRRSVKDEKKLTRKRLYFDIESRTDENGQQYPVLFIGLKCCPCCAGTIPKEMSEATALNCDNCAPDGRLKIIECITPVNEHVDVAKELTNYIFSPLHKDIVAVAHNASGYDGQFILESLIASNKAAPKLCLDGTKVIYLKHKGVKILDSLKYLTMSLSSVAKTFNIDTVKGDFPVRFIKAENFNYVGPVPPNEEFGLENKSPAVRQQLETLLEESRASGTVFNFQNELRRYCYNDVYILAKAMCDFEKSFEEMSDVCLLEESTTAASAAIKVFQRKHLQENTIVLDAKPSAAGNCSVASQKYLAWIRHKENVQVDISTTYGKQKVGEYRVDGFIKSCPKYLDGKILEYYGCYFHGHHCKYSAEAKIGDKTAAQIRRRDKKREKALKALHPLEVVYECEVDQMLKQNKDMAEFFENYEAKDLLHCEKALVGGRTEVFRLYADNVGKKLHYLDVVSLYPTVMKYDKFPIGPPTNVNRATVPTPITTPDGIQSNGVPFDGFVKCRVLPPKRLALPVLPVRVCNRLMFSLCTKCTKTGCQSECMHTDEERAINGTFTTPELKKALSRGYIVTEIFHAVKYDKWSENDAAGNGGLFTSYIKEMMVEKIYSSGYPTDVVTEEEKAAYCHSLEVNEKIVLNEPERFVKNAGKRAVAKLMLNSLWGKMAQRVERDEVVVVIKPDNFWKLMHDTALEIVDVVTVNDCMVVKYRRQVETLESLRTGAVHIAALVTSYARLRLYDLMEKVGGERIIYTDTDSIVYFTLDGEENPLADRIGSFFGQLTDEISGEMEQFVTIGPKTYSYVEKLEGGKTKIVRKGKGITINSTVDKQFTFGLLKKMVDEVLETRTERTIAEFEQFTMTRNKNHQVFAQNFKKQFRFTFNKRKILPDGSTLPFGY
ncbi:hypothetical protein CAEBREN_07775 [Caenorhabditis brenneri]|uniref:DNA-directed DNA polymerase n=1 Tax=Caenorhabditis brenneri TaxID=135651 RepID=G0P374_CAEBE|nr:hypothetical protein CAEBREN_07775 [Caenorhabditis brenneri]